MPVNFDGFISGERVSVAGTSVNTWGKDDVAPPQPPTGDDIWSTPATPGTSVTIEVVRLGYQVAPDHVWFNLDIQGFDTNTPGSPTANSEAFRDKYVFWDLGESYDFVAPTKVLEMDDADGGNRKQARYQMGGHASMGYRTVGQKTIRVTVIEASSGKVGYGDTTISVGDPATVFPNTQTIYVHPTNGGNPPAGARRETSLDVAVQAMRTATAPTRVMLAQGQTFNMSNVNYRPSSGVTNTAFVMVAENGASTVNRPVVNKSGDGGYLITDSQRLDNTARANSATVLQGIDFRHVYDPETDTGDKGRFVYVRGRSAAEVMNFDNITVEGFYSGYIEDGELVPSDEVVVLAYNDSAVYGWGNIGFIGGFNMHLSIRGARFEQKSYARSDISGTTTLGPIRSGAPLSVNAVSTYLFSQTGYNIGGNAGYSSIQPAWRLHGSGELGNTGRKVYIGNCYLCGPRNTLRMEKGDDDNLNPLNALIEGNYIVAGYQANNVVESAFGGVDLRNNVLQHGATKRMVNPIGFFVLSTSGIQTPENTAVPVRFYNNTCVDTTNGSLTSPVYDPAGELDVSVDNNIVHQVNGAYKPDAPLAVLGNVVPPEMAYTEEDNPPDTSYRMTASEGNLFEPATGSPAKDSSVTTQNVSLLEWKPNYLDSARITAEDRDRGAVET